MTLEQLCVSLELAKELEENGYPQEQSYAYWGTVSHYLGANQTMLLTELQEEKLSLQDCTVDEHIDAPTASEIGEQLTEGLFSIDKLEGKWGVYRNCFFDAFYDEKLANALAKMWIFFKKNNLLEEAT